jgi:hypothetical protein
MLYWLSWLVIVPFVIARHHASSWIKRKVMRDE